MNGTVAPMARVTLYNTDKVPVHLDAAGHVLGAGEHGTGDPADPVVAEAIAYGQLVVVEEPVNLGSYDEPGDPDEPELVEIPKPAPPKASSKPTVSKE